ncbi:glycosyltransferase 87 family protein [Streptomyces tanashiensis]
MNLPVMLLAPEGWKKFYLFSRDRSVDFGSIWLLDQPADG